MSVEFRPHDVDWTPEKIGRLWDYYGSNPAFRSQYFSLHSGGAIVERLECDPGLRGRRVLDFGAGRGDLLAHLHARGIAASGLEFSEASAAVCEGRFAGEPLHGGVIATESLPSTYADESSDVVLLIEVLEHLLEEQLAPTLGEVRRLLAPGGHVVVTVPNKEDLAAGGAFCPDCGAAFHRWQHQRSLDAASLSALMESAGFETETVEGIFWGAGRRARALARLRSPQTGLPKPHLLYIGVRPADVR